MKAFDELKEAQVIDKLKKLINTSAVTGLKKIEKGSVLKGKRFRETVEKYYGKKLLWPLIETDLIMIFEDNRKIIDGNLIVAVEIKYFQPKTNTDLDKQLRQAYRECGQPLRNLIYGFDSVILWHIFNEKVEDEKIKVYTNTVNETIKRLNLPMLYFVTKFSENNFKFFQPWDIDYNDVKYLVRSLESSCMEKRNCLPKNEIEEYRNAIKVAIGIP